MPIDDPKPAPVNDTPARHTRPAWLALILGVTLSVGAWWGAAQRIQAEADAALQRDATDLTRRFEEQMATTWPCCRAFRRCSRPTGKLAAMLSTVTIKH
ncbi:hypothetical protein [Aquabacterium sp.]|uniref:hypothetical protein n=1 Tax=Aquabacterium sp. TaxID=1872578 RepID=UPI0035C73EBB